MRLLLLLILSSFYCVQMNAQVTVRGVVEDSATHERLVGASVSYQRKSRTLKFARTDQRGQFAIQMDQVEKDDQLQVTMMGYDKRRYDVPMDPIHLMTIILPSRAFELKEVKVYFGFSSSRIQPSEKSKIDEIAEYMKANPDKKITVTGWASRTGKWQYNLKLSGWRANQVKKALVKRGIDAARIKTEGKGERGKGDNQEDRVAVAISIEK